MVFLLYLAPISIYQVELQLTRFTKLVNMYFSDMEKLMPLPMKYLMETVVMLAIMLKLLVV